MARVPIYVVVSRDGTVEAVSWRDHARYPANEQAHRLDLEGLDGRTLRLFERWLTQRDRTWRTEEIRVFGELLHRRLFTVGMWNWIDQRVQTARADGDVVALMLAFEADAASSRMAAWPWEYLRSPDRPGRDGQFLVLTPGLMLSRSVPPGTPVGPASGTDRVKVLPVVGESRSERLGPVEYEEVAQEIRAAGVQRGFDVLEPLVDATLSEVQEAVRGQQPDLVHYMGHAEFDQEQGMGAIALRKEEDGRPLERVHQWIDEDRLADALCADDWAPSVIVLHACEGGVNDYDFRYAGLGPSLVRRGVRCVVAMQYPVRNSVAKDFSIALYDAIADHQALDQAVQAARLKLWEAADRDARLVGIPTVYQSRSSPLLASAGPGGGT
jgi:hypothetical protein